jgi:surfeit locus 1 family protein
LRRADEKLALQAAIEAQLHAAPLGAASMASEPSAAVLQHYRPVVLKGTWVPGATVFLENRQMRGRPGFFVVTPLLLGPGDAVLVQRGWAPRDQADRTRLPLLPSPVGTVTVEGRISPWPSHLTELGPDALGPIRQNIDRARFSNEFGLTMRPLSVVALAPHDAAATASGLGPDGLLLDWPVPAVDVGKHYGYAAQWFAFCAMIGGLYLWFQIIRPTRTHASKRSS